MMKSRVENYGLLSAAAAMVLLLMVSGCVKKRTPVAVAPRARDAAGLIEMVRARPAALLRMDSNVELRLSGATSAYRGKFSGTLEVDRLSADDLDIRLQVYSLIGAPVLEVISKGERVEVFSPLDHTVYVNFTGLVSGRSVEEFPASSFSDVAIPLDLLREQIRLLWGLGFSDRYRYGFTDTGETFLLTEWNGDLLRREIEYGKSSLDLVRVKVYSGGMVAGGMECGDHGPAVEASGFIPRRIDIYQGESRVILKASRVRTNQEVTSKQIEFRPPPSGRIILLTPPVP